MGHYQRRQKRVAGPGFHINIKMDQQTIQQLRGKNGFSNTSPLLPSSNHPEIYDIKEQELLVAKRAAGSMYHDGYTHCFTAVNGYDVGNRQTREEIVDYILGDVKFVGIATTEQKADDSLIDQGCVATVAGVQTILNNGTQPIHPTDKVMLDINLTPQRASITRDKGIPRQKVRFSVRPADDDLTIISRAMKMCPAEGTTDAEKKEWAQKRDYAKKAYEVASVALKAIPDGGDKTDAETAKKAAADAYREASKKYKECQAGTTNVVDNPQKLREFLRAYRHLNQLVIGKAMSFANPGDRFEILLQPRHCL